VTGKRLRPFFGRAAFVLATSSAAVALVLATSATSRADVPFARNVEVTASGDPAEVAALLDTLRELLGRQQLTLVRPGEAASPLARVRAELPSSGMATVEVTGRTGRLVLRRDVALEGARAIAREAIAHLVQEAVESELLVAEPAAPPPPAAASPDSGAEPASADAAPAAAPPPPAPRDGVPARDASAAPAARGAPVLLDVAMFGGVGPVANGSGPVARVGAGATLAYGSRLRPGLGLLFAYAFPFERSSDVVSARTSLISGRLLPSIELGRTEHFAFDGALGGGLDVISVQPRSETLPPSVLGEGSSRVSAILSGGISARIDVVPSVVFLVSALADVDLVKRSYVVAQGAAFSTVTSPWAVRPTLLLGFAFTALGPPSFGPSQAPPSPRVGSR
jgi:hypothetical protein